MRSSPTPTPTRELLCVEVVPRQDFETELSPRWRLSGNTARSDRIKHDGAWSLKLGGANLSRDAAFLSFALPPEVTQLGLSFFWTKETSEYVRGRDTLRFTLEDALGNVVAEIATLDATTSFSGWRLYARDLSLWADRAQVLAIRLSSDTVRATAFYLDDLQLSVCSRSLPEGCNALGYAFQEEFGADVTQWQVSLGYGSYTLNDSVISLHAQPGNTDRFPVLWTNNAFVGVGDFTFETLFRYSDLTAYGTTIGIGSQYYDGHRYLQTVDPPPGIEDILSIHQLDAWFRIALMEEVVWWGPQGDTSWHYVRVTRQGPFWTLYVDGERIGQTFSERAPRSLFIGNPAIEIWWGTWTVLHVDYLRLTTCLGQGQENVWLPLVEGK